jgi:Regulator of ribonuclease activity B
MPARGTEIEVSADFPNDHDGNALRLVAQHGSDMTQPMLIDFAIDAPTETIADTVVARLKSKDFVSSKTENGDGRWTITVPVMMTPDYEEIVLFQQLLDDDLGRFGAKSDGWGTFGNTDRKTKS